MWRVYTAPMTTTVLHATIMIMLLTCAGLQNQVLLSIYCGNTDNRSGNCPNKPWNNREQLHGTPNALRNQQNQPSNTEILGNASGYATSMGSNTHGCPSQSQPHQCSTKILGNSGSHHTNNQNNSNFSWHTEGLNPTKAVIYREILLDADNHLEVINNSTIKTMAISITGIRGVPSHMHGLMRGTTRGACPLDTHPPHYSIVPFQRPLGDCYCRLLRTSQGLLMCQRQVRRLMLKHTGK